MNQQQPGFPKWRFVSWMIRFLVAVNLALIFAVLLFHWSRSLAIEVFWIFKTSALALLLLVPTEYLLRRTARANLKRLSLDAALALVMFCIWFFINAATF